jgi:Autotransporter beta-domain
VRLRGSTNSSARKYTIQINSGALYFNSSIAGSTVPTADIYANGSAVGGTGVWVANLDVMTGGVSAGAIPINLDSNPENAVGSFTILGDVVHSPGSFIRMDIIPDTAIFNGINSDLIVQNGVGNTYDVTGANLRISSTDVNRVITPGTYTIVDSDEAIIGFNSLGTVGVQFNANTPDTGDFLATGSGSNYEGSVFTNFFTTPGLANGNTNLVMDVDYDFASLPGLSPTESALGGALDTLALRAGTGRLGLGEQDLISALALSDLDSVQASLTGLSPESGVAMVAGVINSNCRIHRMLQDHLAHVRGNSGSVTMSNPEPIANSDGKGGMTYSQPQQQSSSSRGTFWGSVSYDEQDYNGTDRRSDFEGDTQAITAGFDYRVSPMFVIGGLIDGSRSDFGTGMDPTPPDWIYGLFGK